MKRIFLLLLLVCSACSPQVQPFIPGTQSPELHKDALITSGGVRLPLRSWLPKSSPKAVIIALHGMNDYSNAFTMPGEAMSKQGIAVYAYDQRSFGESDNKRIWPGEENLVSDLRDMVALMKKRYSRTPLYILGESMGGAVVIAAYSAPGSPPVDGIILSAPGIWGGTMMSGFYHSSLWAIAHIVPDKLLTGQGLHILASDNIPMLRELAKDPLVQKGARADSVLGLVRLMDKGYDNIKNIKLPLLILYGQHDQVVSPYAIAGSMEGAHPRFAYYPQGYHLLLRDLHRGLPTNDIVSWIGSPETPLPSGYDNVQKDWQDHHKAAPIVESGIKHGANLSFKK